MIVLDNHDQPTLLLPCLDGRLLVEVVAHVPPEFGPKDAILLAIDLGHGDFFQTAVVRLGEKYERDVFEGDIVVGDLEVLATVVDDSVRERLVVCVVDDDADATVGEDVPNAVFLAVVDPFGDEGDVIGWRVPIAEGR